MLSTAVPKGTPRGLERGWKRAAKETRLKKAYADVDARDGGYSVISGVWTDPNSADPRKVRVHHHMHGRNARPDLRENPNYIVTMTEFEHQLVHAGAIDHEGDDMRKRIVWHWNRTIVPAGKEPFRIRSKRWSMNRED